MIEYTQEMGENFMEKTLVVEGNVIEIERSKYSSMEIENLEIKEGVIIIGERAFFGNNIKKVYLPKSVKKVGDAAFMDNKVEELTFYNNGIEFGNECFSSSEVCSDNIKIVGFLEKFDFVCYSPIKKITIIYGDYEILSKILSSYRCFFSNLQQINIVNNNISISDAIKIRKFAYTYGLEGIKINLICNNIQIIEDDQYRSMGIESFEIKEGVEIIEERAFFGNNIKKVYLPKSVKKVGDAAFMHNGVEELTFHNNGIEFGEECFSLMREAENYEDCPSGFVTYSPIQKLTIIDGDYVILFKILCTAYAHNLFSRVQQINIVNNNMGVFELTEIKELANKYPKIKINIIRNNVLIFTNQNDLLIEEQNQNDLLDEESIQRCFEKIKKLYKK